MRYLIGVMALLLMAWSWPAESCTFRVAGGQLVRCGMSKIEVIDKMGQPQMRDTESLGVNAGFGRRGETVEVWSYLTRGDIGGKRYVSIYFSGNNVVDIKTKQQGRP